MRHLGRAILAKRRSSGWFLYCITFKLNETDERVVKVSHVDVRNYAKYLLREGTIFEKRELLSCLRSKFLMANKKITVSA